VPNNHLANELARIIRIVVVHRVPRLAEIAPARDTFKNISTSPDRQAEAQLQCLLETTGRLSARRRSRSQNLQIWPEDRRGLRPLDGTAVASLQSRRRQQNSMLFTQTSVEVSSASSGNRPLRMDERANRGDAPAHVAAKIAESDDAIESLKKVRKALPPTDARCGGCGPIEQLHDSQER
jgi:hypothetical protein